MTEHKPDCIRYAALHTDRLCDCGASEDQIESLQAEVANGRRNRLQHRVIGGVEYKFASCCRLWLPVEKFQRCASTWDGLQSECRACNTERKRSQKQGKK